jgi:hypothetical protein
MSSVEAFKRELSRKLYNYMKLRGKFKAGLLALWLYREICQKNPVYREIWENMPFTKRFSKVLLEELQFRGWIFYKSGFWIINAPPPVEELESIFKHLTPKRA